MQIQIKKKCAWTLIISTIDLFIIPVIATFIEPLTKPTIFDKIGKYWLIGGSVLFWLIVVWVLIAGQKNR